MICSNCGAQLNENAKFCSACGTLTGPPAAVPVYSPPPQEPAYNAPVYTPPPQEPAYNAPVYTPPPQEPVYNAPVYTPPPQDPVYNAPVYTPPPQDPVYNAPNYFVAQSPAAGTGGKPLNMKIIIPAAAAAFLVAVFSALWLFTGIFTSGPGKTDTSAGESPGEPAGGTASTASDSPTPSSPSSEPTTAATTTPSATPTPVSPEPVSPEPASPVEPWADPTLTQIHPGDHPLTEASFFRFSETGTWEFRTYNSGDSDPYLKIYNADGNELAGNDDGAGDLDAVIIIELDSPVTIEVGFWWSTSTSTTLSISPVSTTEPATGDAIPEGGGEVRINGPTSLSFVPNQTGIWVLYTANNQSSDPILAIRDSAGNVIMEDDDNMGDYNAELVVFLFEGEIHTVDAGFWSSGSGSYDLIVKAPETIPANGGVIDMVAAQGFIFVPDQNGEWEFRTSNSGVYDPFLVLYDDEWFVIADDDDGGEGYNAMFIVTLTAGERYHLYAGFLDSGPAPYTLTVTKK